MNNKKAKKLRKILPPENAMAKRAYRRAKKFYSRLPENAKADFLAGLEAMTSN
jgi:hypothetical protein